MGDSRLSNDDIARMAGVKPSSVSNWKKRHSDFPEPDQETRYAADEIARWLTRRRIPANVRLPGEGTDSTFADRFRKALGGSRTGDEASHRPPVSAARPVPDSEWKPPSDLWNELEKRRGAADMDAYEELVIALLHLHRHARPHWAALVRAANEPSPDRIGHLLTNILAQHRPRHRGVAEALRRIRPVLWSDWQLAEIVRILDQACSGAPGDARPAARTAITCRFLLDRFATADRVRGAEFYTPDHLVRLMVRLLDPKPGDHVHDPCCGNGSLLAGAAAYVEQRSGESQSLTITGQALGERSLRLAKLNLAIHGTNPEGKLRRADPLRKDLHQEQRFDVILANPPFNKSHWSQGDPAGDPRWRYGAPPQHNANFAWLQHIAGKLSSQGRAAVLMPNVAAVSASEQEAAIRAGMVKDGVVEAVIMLPEQLFRATPVPITLWLLRRRPRQESGRVLFIDARTLGAKADRAHRVLRDDDIGRIVGACDEWRRLGAAYTGIAGFSASATKEMIEADGRVLAPNRYVVPERHSDAQADQRIRELHAELARLREEAAVIDAHVDHALKGVFG
ncbi:N-6 DNA methylase [Actinoallomurus iriomotensis]|uniref:DNA methylase adenine-specific domain-containing protein n=1 Tax=Actinoallomurus iriomotensis TaxID=478107 RepID=A0A9W6RUW3_9ACTN|nr:N-6 DNA methylase [Actinoallomurus iriomotensis]GLY82291.1 hypothetical protein Airi02_002230 [Actinoallomurus iriomotensis]